jgi:hypothetical protein
MVSDELLGKPVEGRKDRVEMLEQTDIVGDRNDEIR